MSGRFGGRRHRDAPHGLMRGAAADPDNPGGTSRGTAAPVSRLATASRIPVQVDQRDPATGNRHVMTDEQSLRELVSDTEIDVDALLAAPLVLYGQAMGLYHALSAGRLTAGELAARCGAPARDVMTWLRAQTASGHVTRDAEGRYYLTPEQALILVEDEMGAWHAVRRR